MSVGLYLIACMECDLYAKKNDYIFNIAKKADSISVNRKFVIFVPSYNNERFCEKNIQSILDQTYHNYRVVYIDDASTDNTFELVSRLVKSSGKENKFVIIKNEVNVKNINNLYNLVHFYCEEDEIVVNLDGDDFFAHTDVLTHLNAYYQSPDVWMTWGNYICWSNGALGCHAKPVKKIILKEGLVRKEGYCYSHLKTFYAKLFKQVKKEDLMVDGQFAQLAPDLLTMYPILEMARLHAFFIPEVLYIYNDMNNLSEANVCTSEAYYRVVDTAASLPVYSAIKYRDW